MIECTIQFILKTMKYLLGAVSAIIIILIGVYIYSIATTKNADDNSTISIGSSTLNLSNKGYKRLPDDTFKKTNTTELNASNNSLEGSVQGEIRFMSNLRVLNLSNNRMTGVPAEIGQLSKLEVLDLSNNLLTGLPNELGNLQNLKTLNISGNKYSVSDLNSIIEKLPNTVKIIK